MVGVSTLLLGWWPSPSRWKLWEFRPWHTWHFKYPTSGCLEGDVGESSPRRFFTVSWPNKKCRFKYGKGTDLSKTVGNSTLKLVLWNLSSFQRLHSFSPTFANHILQCLKRSFHKCRVKSIGASNLEVFVKCQHMKIGVSIKSLSAYQSLPLQSP